MYRRSERTLVLALLIAAAVIALVSIGIATTSHPSASMPASVPAKHIANSNELAPSGGNSNAVASHYANIVHSWRGGPCPRCVIDHPYEAAAVGA